MANIRSAFQVALISLATIAAPIALTAAPPPITVSTVPWIPTSPASPHYSWTGKQVTLKGTSNTQDSGSGTILYDWNPGDGGTHCTGTVTNKFVIECVHTYNGAVGTLFNAVLTVYDTTTSNGGTPPVYSNSASASYFTSLFGGPPNLQAETNAAIDAGLWYLHKDMTRYIGGRSVASISLTNGGSGYEADGSTAPVVSFTGCSTSPTATAVVDNGSPSVGGPGVVTSLILNSPGAGCTAPVGITISDPLQPENVTSVTLTNGGQNYQLEYYGGWYGFTNFYLIGANGTGSGGYGSATVDTNTSSATFGQVISIALSSGGSGYEAPVSANFVDEYGGCTGSQYNYKNPSAPGYAGDGNPQPCGTGATLTATVSPRTGSDATATVTLSAQVDLGDWSSCIDNATACGIPVSGITAANCTAFEVSGHLEGGPASDPYTDDVKRCMLGIYSRLQSTAIPNSKSNSFGSFNPDQNGNGLGVTITEGQDMYQNGMIMDAIVATGTPNQPVTFGLLANLTHPGGGGAYTYQDAVRDMADYYVYCETGGGSAYSEGSWQYSCNSGQDNSVAQWAAIGLIGARRNFGSALPTDALLANQAWLGVSQAPGFGGNGYFGYNSASPIWGPFADTPSGMVQLAMNGIGRGPAGTPTQWDWAETFMRDNFDTPQSGCASCDVKDYYYGMFSFTKSMLLHDNSGTGTGNTPIQTLQSLDNPGTHPPIDWYAAQSAAFGGSDTSNGVARTLISGSGTSGQNADGSWYGHNYNGEQYYFETAWAIIMLNHTVFQQVPTACASYSPNPATDAVSVQLNGQCSTDPNPAPVTITTWQWDIDGAGGTHFTVTGVKPNVVLTAPASATLPYAYPVRLRVTDSLGLTSDLVFNVTLNNPAGAAPPSANAGGPYNFCPNETAQGVPVYVPWYLNGSLSTQSGGFHITAYDWDFNCAGTFTDASGPQPRVDTGANNLFNHNPTPFNVCLRVTNDTGISQDATAVASAQVTVHSPTDPQCSHCVSTQSAKAKNFAPGSPGNAQIYWIDTNNASFPVDHFNVYRSTVANFSTFVQVAGASGHYPAIPAQAGGGEQLLLIDGTIPAPSSTPYYYRIAPATSNDTETCASPITLSVIVGGRR